MTIEQIKSEMISLMEKVSKLEMNNGEVSLTKEQLTVLVKLVIEDTTREIRDGLRDGMSSIDDYIDLSLNDREIYVDVDDSKIMRDITELVDEKGLGVTFNQNEMTVYVGELMTRIKQ